MNRRDAAGVYQRLAAETQQVASELEALAAEATRAVEATRSERDRVAGELATVYLPSLTPEALTLAGQWTGYRGFTRRDPLKAMVHEGARLKSELAQVLAHPSYRDRAALVGPQGSLTRSLAEAKEFLAPWQVECDRFERLEGFLELITLHYDTPEFEERWWQPSYWRHWSAGDRICDTLGMADFGDEVRPAYEKVAAPRDQWKAEVARFEGEIGAVHALVQRHDRLADRLTHLGDIYLAECQHQLAEHLRLADPAMLELWSRGEPPIPEDQRRGVVALLKALSGLAAKIDAQTQVGDGWAQIQAQTLKQTAGQFHAKAAKLLRNPRKLGMETSAPPVQWREKLARMSARTGKARSTLVRVRRYSEYDRFSLQNDPAMWWLLFADHSPPPVWLPVWHTWHTTHHGVTLHLDDDAQEERGRRALSGVGAHEAHGDVS